MAFEIFWSIKHVMNYTKQQPRKHAVLSVLPFTLPSRLCLSIKECENNRLQQLKRYLFGNKLGTYHTRATFLSLNTKIFNKRMVKTNGFESWIRGYTYGLWTSLIPG